MDGNGVGLELAEGAVRNLRATSATARDVLELSKYSLGEARRRAQGWVRTRTDWRRKGSILWEKGRARATVSSDKTAVFAGVTVCRASPHS